MPDKSEIAALVLAAGASSRFGSDKLLHSLTLNNLTLPLAAHSLLPWVEVFSQVTVVIRPGTRDFCSEIETALGMEKSAAIRWCECQEAAGGMALSLACGVRANREAGGWLIGLADMPAVPSAAVASMRNALIAGAELAAPYCDGRRGHPVGFSSQYFEDLCILKGDAGARGLLERDSSKIMQIKFDNKGVFIDIDNPGDIQNL